ncbi:hypothetical protein [Desulfobacter sp.]|nr:hypothetical protein [Desulfobacter sp.]
MVSPRLVGKIESEEPTLRLAVLIDGDNAQTAVIEGLLSGYRFKPEHLVE